MDLRHLSSCNLPSSQHLNSSPMRLIDGELATSVDVAQPAISWADVTTSQSHVTTTSRDVYCPPRCHEDAFLAGFRDCTREALVYLRQRDVDSAELEQHLVDVERRWLCGEHDGADSGSPLPPPHRSQGDDSALGMSLVNEDEEEEVRSEDVGLDLGQSSVTSELSENACELLKLAQNNPRINNILNELFTLMDDDENEDQDDDADCEHSVCELTCDDQSRIQLDTDDVMTSHDAVSDVSQGT